MEQLSPENFGSGIRVSHLDLKDPQDKSQPESLVFLERYE